MQQRRETDGERDAREVGVPIGDEVPADPHQSDHRQEQHERRDERGQESRPPAAKPEREPERERKARLTAAPKRPILASMKTEAVLAYFGNDRRKLAQVLGISVQSTYDWGEHVPKLRAYELERLTGGALVVDDAPEPMDAA